MTTVTNLIEDVELYLEGVRIPTFNSIQISEQENTIPAAQISFAANANILRVLPGTVVQVFTKVKVPNKDSETTLAFEGQVTHMTYSRGFSNDVVTFKAISLLSEMTRATLRPGHTIITSARNDAELNHVTTIRVNSGLNYKGKPIFAKDTTANKDTENATKQTQEYYDGTLDQLKEIASFGDIANTMATAMGADTEAAVGNFSEFLKEMNRFFMQSDIYYGIQSASYKLGQSVISLPNRASGFDLKVAIHGMNQTLTTMNQYPTGADMIHILMNLLEQFRNFLSLKYICPASPIAAKYFHVMNDSDDRLRPVRMMFMPDFESAPPPLCNIFFPEQVTSMNFSRDFISEPTRVIGQLNYSFIKGNSIPGKMMPITVVPDVRIHKITPDKDNITSKYTDEETYRGVVSKVSQHDGVVIQALYDAKNETTVGDKKSIAPLNENDKKDIHPALQRMVLNDYLFMKYGQRAVQITADWSPYRIVGLPGMIFEIGKPTIIGIIAAISTQITADGQAQSQITMRNCKILFDETVSDSAYVKDPASEKTTDRLEDYVVSDFVNAGFLGANPMLYKEEYYGMQTIGKEIYPYFITGHFQQGEVYKFFKGRKIPYNIEKATKNETGNVGGSADFTFNYDTNKDEILSKHTDILKAIQTYVGTAKGALITVRGYTDDVDTAKFNIALSKRRAENVTKALKGWVTADITTTWHGKTDFTASNKTEEGRAKNRRVTVTVSKAGNMKDYSIVRYVDLPNFNKTQKAFTNQALEVTNTKLIYQAIAGFKSLYKYYLSAEQTTELMHTLTYRQLLTKPLYLASINESLKLDDTAFNGWKSNSKDLQSIMQNKDLAYSSIVLTAVSMNDMYNNQDVSSTGYYSEVGKTEAKIQTDLLNGFQKQLTALGKANVALAAEMGKNNPATLEASSKQYTANQKEIQALNKSIAEVKAGTYRASQDSATVTALIKDIVSANRVASTDPKSVREKTSIFRPYNTTRRAHVQEIVKSFSYLKLTLPNQKEDQNNPSNLIASR